MPDHISSVPEAVAAVAHDGTVYIRKGATCSAFLGVPQSLVSLTSLAMLVNPETCTLAGYYHWDGVLVVQKHMHIRGEPNPDEGQGGSGRPTLEGRWLLGERSSGSFQHVNCIARFDNKGAQQGAAEQSDAQQ